MGTTFQRLEGVFDATPLARSLRQEVEGFVPFICLMELIDNAVEATIEREEPTIVITLNLDKVDASGGPEPATLTIEDNGKGMSMQQLLHYFRVSYTTSRIPPIDRDSQGVLPLHNFVNRKLNRFGRGSASVVYFGDMVEIESFQLDYGELLRTNKWPLQMYEKDQEVVEEDLNGWTIIRISQLLPDKERALRDVAGWEQLAKRLRQVYHLFIYGFPECLWDKLPRELTNGSNRPKGGLTIELTALSGGTTLFSSRLSRDPRDGLGPGDSSASSSSSCGPPSDLQAVLREWEQLVAANPLLAG
ncbi:hypothetical protein PLESTM_001615900 [Pleodorina starrii]|nr:hypothetical protein PLESTM_001615900 [Pleodorina starrii]